MSTRGLNSGVKSPLKKDRSVWHLESGKLGYRWLRYYGWVPYQTDTYINTTTLRASTRTYKITKAELLPGDLVFRNSGSVLGVNHVGIFAYFDANNRIVAYDCASSVNKILKRARPTIWESSDSIYYRYIDL